MSDERREGDQRPFAHDTTKRLTFLPERGKPFRWLPRHGEPSCVGEWLAQHLVILAAWLPFYTAVVVTLMLIVQLFHPLGLGR